MPISKEIANTIVDPQAYAHWDRSHEAYKELRANAPLAIAEPDEYDPFWVVTRFADIQTVEKDNDLFHSTDRPATLFRKEQIALMAAHPPEQPIKSLVQMDPPEHPPHRALTQDWFMPLNLKNLEARLREIAEEFADKMFEYDGECDFARDVAFLYPLRVVMEVMGVPPEDELQMLKLTQELFGAEDPELNRSGEAGMDVETRMKMVAQTTADFFEYFTALSEDRRKNPREDLATVIANAEINGKPIGHIEAMGYYIIAATAGHDTTSATTASAAWVLAERPDLLARIKDDPSLIPKLVEESIRWETPVKHFMRTATRDTELADQKIAKGDWLMLAYPSGNRDEERIPDPFTFDIDRRPNRHVAFGFGAHVCLGQHLARLEMRLLWEAILPRLKSLELNGTPTRMVANFVSGPKSVPVRFIPE